MIFYYQNDQLKNFYAKRTQDLYEKYINCNYLFHLTKNPSELLRNLEGEVDNVRGFFMSSILFLKEIVFLIFLFISVLLLSNFIITFSVILTFVIISSLYYFIFRGKIKTTAQKSQSHRFNFQKIVLQSIGSIKEIKILQKESFFFKNYKDEIFNLEKYQLHHKFISFLPKLFLEITAVALVLGIVVYYYNLSGIVASLPILSLYVVVILKIIPSFNLINSSLADLKYSSVSVGLLKNEYDLIKNNTSHINKTISNPKLIFNNLEFDNVNFSYEGSIKNVKNMSFSINKGEFIGITGKSGSGKSTTLNLLLGLIEPNSGLIKINGNPLIENIYDWQSIVGYVPQDTYLLDSSIKENICFGVEKNMIDEILYKDCLKKTEMLEFTDSLVNKDETIIGDRGIRISGGQRQRIAIARSLYTKPQILILDEATSSLDPETEKYILKNLVILKKEMTIIMISHKETIHEFVDRIYKIDAGIII